MCIDFHKQWVINESMPLDTNQRHPTGIVLNHPSCLVLRLFEISKNWPMVRPAIGTFAIGLFAY
jgi:hypothetical protein